MSRTFLHKRNHIKWDLLCLAIYYVLYVILILALYIRYSYSHFVDGKSKAPTNVLLEVTEPGSET